MKIEATFRAVQDKFDIIDQLELHGNINDPSYLREELQRNSFLLAHQKVENEKRQTRVLQLLEANRRSAVETQGLRSTIKDLNQKLESVQSRLYDIASEDESSFEDDKL